MKGVRKQVTHSHEPLLHSGLYFPFLPTPIAGALAPLDRASFYDSNSATYVWGHALYEEIRGLPDSCLHPRRGCILHALARVIGRWKAVYEASTTPAESWETAQRLRRNG